MPRYRILDATVKFLSLCKRGKNKMPVLYKSEEDVVNFEPLFKMNEEQGELLAVVYVPDVYDTDGDIAGKEAIRKMAHSFAREGYNLDIRHEGEKLTREQAYVAESFIVQKGDSRFSDWTDYDDKPVDVTDAWATVIKIDDQELRKAFREDGWNGVSLEAKAHVEKLSKSEPPSPPPGWGRNKEDDTMKIEDIQKLIEANNATLLKQIDEKLTVIQKKADEKPDAKTEGVDVAKALNPLDPKAVEKHLEAIRAEELRKSVDWNNPEAVAAHLESLRKSDEDAGLDAREREIKRLKAALAKAEGASNYKGSPPAAETDLQKEFDEGKELAKLMASSEI